MKYIIVEDDIGNFYLYISINGIAYKAIGECSSLSSARQSLVSLFNLHKDNILSSDNFKFIEEGEI